jgi:hypothetical protein
MCCDGICVEFQAQRIHDALELPGGVRRPLPQPGGHDDRRGPAGGDGRRGRRVQDESSPADACCRHQWTITAPPLSRSAGSGDHRGLRLSASPRVREEEVVPRARPTARGLVRCVWTCRPPPIGGAGLVDREGHRHSDGSAVGRWRGVRRCGRGRGWSRWHRTGRPRRIRRRGRCGGPVLAR